MTAENGYDRLQRVISTLLGPDGCPWDREQSPQTLCDYLVEETYELISAIASGSISDIQEEMGDVFFLLFFMAHFYRDEFSLDQVWKNSADKMINRHPHVFEDESIQTREELLRNWEKIKKKEKAGRKTSLLGSIPRNLPPVLMAYRANSKAARAGFTWDSDRDLEEKLQEEWSEFQKALELREQESAEMEFGDYLFTLVELGRRKKIKANTALSRANAKFLGRVEEMEKLAREMDQDLADMDAGQLNELWNRVKSGE